ncbi:flavin reductase family protein [Frankia sp. Cppng1_Ct_nod]|uniref:flavin reductase family protein n=1 Tax=Frankia sp. Cppng1_Ct_nod TaxID=2897162 RepID=UPI001040F2CE|nr:flavin reductase family protein [Frankia sp. Cppng1_Ct_nod]
MAVDPDAFRRAVGRFATGVTVITTVLDGQPFAITANSFTSVSLDPLLVLVGVRKASRFHAPVLGSGVWGVSVLAADMQDASRFFASQDRHDAGILFDGWKHSVGAETGVVLLEDALAAFECRTVLAYEGGDHTLLLGEVVALDGFRREASPLLFYEGTYRVLPPTD